MNAPVVLIADDNPANLKVLSDILVERGFDVRVAANGSQAISVAENSRPEIILLDVHMPELDGYEACTEIKKLPGMADVPVLFVSALNEAFNKVWAFEIGAVDYITKPFSVEEVNARVDAHLRLHQLHRRSEEIILERTEQLNSKHRELAAAHERLRERDSIINDFLSMIEHELRTPLNGLLGTVELLMIDREKITPEMEEIYEAARSRMMNLVEDSIVLSRLEDRQSGNDSKPMPVRELVAQAESLARDPAFQVSGDAATSFALETEFTACEFLMERSLSKLFALAGALTESDVVEISATREPKAVIVRLSIRSSILTNDVARTFFQLTSKARIDSPAEEMGLAPVVAEHILRAFGGSVALEKLPTDDSWSLKISLPVHEPCQLLQS